MLIDYAEITVRGGHGGAKPARKPKRAPFGNGGKGGNVYFLGSSNIDLLNQFSQKNFFVAENGELGHKNHMSGKNGKDLNIYLPSGTAVYEKVSKNLLFEIVKPADKYLVCKGGKGGYGLPETRSGEPGGERKLILSLRLIADIGLVGLPNAGKSSLLNELTNAKAVIANYPFTTLEPNLGVFEGKCIADIPGLIEGASSGKGLGISFLKHIEKVGTILHCISSETQNPIKDYETIRKELKSFGSDLTDKSEAIVLTKTDTINEAGVKTLVKKLEKKCKRVLPVSIYNPDSIESLKNFVRNILKKNIDFS